MLGIVLGTVPITVFGLLVSAWLQFLGQKRTKFVEVDGMAPSSEDSFRW